jgi:hypothetical protein
MATVLQATGAVAGIIITPLALPQETQYWLQLVVPEAEAVAVPEAAVAQLAQDTQYPLMENI